jgi:hypothetical protein
MSVLVDIDGLRMIVIGRRVSLEDPVEERVINAILAEVESPSHPHPDLASAQHLIDHLGMGRIIEATPIKLRRNRVY